MSKGINERLDDFCFKFHDSILTTYGSVLFNSQFILPSYKMLIALPLLLYLILNNLIAKKKKNQILKKKTMI